MKNSAYRETSRLHPVRPRMRGRSSAEIQVLGESYDLSLSTIDERTEVIAVGSDCAQSLHLRSKGSLSPSVGLPSETFYSNAQEQTRSQGFGIKELSPASWTADNDKLWLRDLLPRDVPSARILTYGYDAYTEITATSSTRTLDDHAENFLAHLAALRASSDTTKRPIIFIPHSLGGIILKHALIQASQAHRGHLVEHKWISLSTYGILFLATPHQGTTAITNPANQLMKLASLLSKTNNVLSKHLISNSEWLEQQSSYSAISANFHTKFFHEALKIILPDKSSRIIVPKFSVMISGANMEVVGMSKDYNGMTKFAFQSDDDFIFISTTIQDMGKKAPPTIQLCWSKFEKAQEAEVLELEVLEAQQLILGPEHPHTILAKANLASTYSDLGRAKEAEVLKVQVFDGQQLMLGLEHPDTIMARTYSDLGRHKEAEVLKLQVLDA
ncbi:hypothetical protein BU17DRAFT_89673 [Hysterangium stoloniferum]|nr:hypothetical protein BU17DRAFT_89673 [Hysterangium stoloniferum]